MSITYPARPLAAPWTGRATLWLATRRERRAARQVERELADLPPHLLRDVGLVDLAHAREAHGGRTFDHTQPPCALSSWTW